MLSELRAMVSLNRGTRTSLLVHCLRLHALNAWGMGLIPSGGRSHMPHVLSRFSRVQLFATLWAVAHQAPLFMGFSRQEYWSRVSCPPPGDLLHPGMESVSLKSPALAGGFFTTCASWETLWRWPKKRKEIGEHIRGASLDWTVRENVVEKSALSL